MIDFSKKLQDEVDIYNELLKEEQQATERVTEIKEKRTIQLGKVQALDALLQEHLKEESIKAGKQDAS